MKLISLVLKVVLLVVLLVSCNSNSVKQTSLISIDVREALSQQDKQVKLSTIANNLNYIRLETNDSNLLSNVSNLNLTQKYIIVSDSKSIYQFDLNGKFIRQIGKTGDGPGEYGNRIKYRINEEIRKIIVFSYPDKVNIYDLDIGKFEKSFKINFTMADFEIFPNNKIAFFPQEINGRNNHASANEIILTDYSGNSIDSLSSPNRLKNRNNIVGYIHLYETDQKLYYMGTYKDTLFELNKDFIKNPYAYFNLKNTVEWENLIITPDKEKELKDFVTVFKPLENEKYFFIAIQVRIPVAGKRLIRNMIYEKKTQEISSLDKFINDIDGGLNFWPQFIINDKFVDYCNAYELIDYYKSIEDKSNLSAEFQNIANKLSEQDNPVIIVASNVSN